METGKPNVA